MSRRLLTSRPRARRLHILVGTVASVLAFNVSSEAAIFLWDNGAGGSYSTSSNWTPLGPPGAADTARFNLGIGYAVSFTANQTASVLDVIAGTPTFSAGGAARTYTVSSATLHGGDLL